MTLKMNIPEIHEFLDRVFPQMKGAFEVLELAPYRLKLRMTITEDDLRPGGTVSGPAMFTAVDCAYYIATLSMIGPELGRYHQLFGGFHAQARTGGLDCRSTGVEIG